MANPQPENGHIDIANEIAEKLAGFYITGEEYQVLWVIWRKTWGWHKKKDWISLPQFESLTHIKKPNIIRTIKKLISKNIIIKEDNRIIKEDNEYHIRYGFNKNFDSWKALSKKIIGLSKKITGVIKEDKRSLSSLIPTKENYTKETITKERANKILFLDCIYLETDQYQKLCDKFGKEDTNQAIFILNAAIMAKGEKHYGYKSHYHVLLRWPMKEAKGGQLQEEGGIAKWLRSKTSQS